MFDKKGSGLLMNPLIIIVVSLFFMSLLVVASVKIIGGDAVYEQAFAKEIALMLDGAYEGMTLTIYVDKLQELAKKNHYTGEIIIIDEDKGTVRVGVKGDRKYSYNYYTNYDLEYKISGNTLSIVVGGKR